MIKLKQNFLTVFKEYLLVSVGIFLYVLAWTVFLIPNNLVGGGVSGIGAILEYATHGKIQIGYTFFVLNIVLIALSIFIIGKSFGGKTIYAIILASICFKVFPHYIPKEIIEQLAIVNGKLLCVIMGGISAGLGIGISISQGGSTGGTDIVALIVNKYRNVSPGKIILMLDVVIILSSIFIPSYLPDGTQVGFADKFTNIFYGLILVNINSYVVDLYLSGAKQSVQLFILSKKYEEIADSITVNFHRGVTVLNGMGWFTKQKSSVLMVVARKSDLNLMLKYIKTIDNDAFLSVSSVTAVYGYGFDRYKLTKKKNK